MERKALENLDAARRLLEADDPCSNAAVSRAYYAAYQACWSAMVDAGHSAPRARPGVHYFKHEVLPQEALQARVLDEQEGQDLDYLRIQRIRADYYEDDVTLEEAREALRLSGILVHRLLEERP